MAKKIFRINGRVIDRQTKQGIAVPKGTGVELFF